MKDLILKSLIEYDKAFSISFLFEYKFKLILDIFNNKSSWNEVLYFLGAISATISFQ